MKKQILVYYLFIATTGLCQLPQYHARIFDARNGLSANQINTIFKDGQDFLWIVYNKHIEKFDGRVVQRFAFPESIVHTANDQKNNIWVISNENVYRLAENSMSFEKVPIDSGKGRLLRIFRLPATPLCLMTNSGYYEWSENSNSFRKMNKPFLRGTLRSQITYFDTCNNTIFFPGGQSQLYAYDFANDKIDSLPVNSLYGVHAITPTLAVYTNFKGYAYWCDFKNKKLTLIDPRHYFPGKEIDHFRISGVVPLSGNRFLMLTKAGLMEYDLAQDKFKYAGIYEEGRPFEFENTLSNLLIDRNGILWAHAETMVTSITSIHSWFGLLRNNESDPSKKMHNAITSFARGSDDDLWMSTGRGFARLKLNSGKLEVFHPVENATDRLSHESIRGILFDGKWVIIAPTDKGIWLYDPVNKVYRRPKYTSEEVKRFSEQDFYDMIYSVRNGDHFFPGRDTVYIMDGKTRELRFFPLPGRRTNANVVLQDSLGRIWIGTHSGLYCFDEQYQFLNKINTGSTAILSLFSVSNDELMAGTTNGMIRIKLNKREPVIISEKTPFMNVPVASIFRDSLNRFWFVTHDGIYLSDPDLSAFRVFDYGDNVQSTIFFGNSYYREPNGMVFLGGFHGINYFYPEDFTLQDKPLNVFVRSVIVNNTDTIAADALKDRSFSHDQKRIWIELSSPYFNNPGNIRYRYQLKGLNDEWVDNGNNPIVSFSSLAPGNYELRTAVSTTGKHWYESKEAFHFAIKPPFWKQSWFMILAGLLAAGLLVLLQSMREKYIRHKEEEKLQREQLKAENLQFRLEANQAQLAMLENERKAATAKLQSMRLQMNPHFLFNALNSIQQMIMTGKEDKATLYLSKFSKLLRMVLTHSDREIVSLREETEMLKLYIELEALRFEDTFVYKVELNENVDPDDNKVPTLLIQPFVENAIWHGLLHKEGLRTLNVRFKMNENEDLVCTVEDNGIGREASKIYSKKTNQKENHTGKGVSVADERLKIFNQQNGDSSKLDIDDIREADGSIAGTRVTITLPNLG